MGYRHHSKGIAHITRGFGVSLVAFLPRICRTVSYFFFLRVRLSWYTFWSGVTSTVSGVVLWTV
jgi:hypothetical protein